MLIQNIALALGIKAVFLVLALAGHATLWIAVFADMGARLLVVANGLRLLNRTGNKREVGATRSARRRLDWPPSCAVEQRYE